MTPHDRTPDVDPIPDGLTAKERRAVERQGEVIALQQEWGAPRLSQCEYEFGDCVSPLPPEPDLHGSRPY
jgi:hypothetical protein